MRILLADNQVDVRSALRFLLKHQLGWQVVGEAVDLDSLSAELEATQPDLLLVDWAILGTNGGAVLPALRARYPDLRVIVMSGGVGIQRAALEGGAIAFVSKGDSPDRLLAALKKVDDN